LSDRRAPNENSRIGERSLTPASRRLTERARDGVLSRDCRGEADRDTGLFYQNHMLGSTIREPNLVWHGGEAQAN
jgi:hypothetical protein